MTKALVALNHATSGGVYYTSNLDFTNSAAQPTWTKYATTGLSSTLIMCMQNDPVDPYNKIYVHLSNDDVFKWNGSSWDLIIDLATARTLSGYASGVIGYIAANKAVTGTIYLAICSLPMSGGKIKLLKSVDYGTNWTVSTVVSQNLVNGSPFVSAYENHVFVCGSYLYRSLYYSANGGATFDRYSIFGSGGGGDQVNIDPKNPTYCYYYTSPSDGDLSKFTVNPNTVTQLQNGSGLGYTYSNTSFGIDTAGGHWFNPTTSGYQRILYQNGGSRMYSTHDGWATLVEGSPTDWSGSIGIEIGQLAAALENSDYMLIGCASTGEAGKPRIWAKSGETTSDAPWSVPGTNHATPPYTNAIPSVADSLVALYGVFVGESPASSGVYVYADEQGDITALPTYTGLGIPLFGDRSAWRDMPADGYDIYHAQDVQAVTPQIHAPWDDASPPASGYGIISDGTKWEVSSDEIALDSDLHDAVTLDADAAVVLDLNGQEIGLDTQSAGFVFIGPVAGAANEPTFRALVLQDLPDDTHEHIINIDFTDLCDGAETVFPSPAIFRARSSAVYLNGIRQRLDTHYTEAATYDSITMGTAPESGDELVMDVIISLADWLAIDRLLLESADYFLLETGDKMILE